MAVSVVDRVAQKMCREDLVTQSALAASREVKFRDLQRQLEELKQRELQLRQQLVSETVEHQNKIAHLQSEIGVLREDLVTTKTSYDAVHARLSRLQVSVRKRRWRRFSREARRWVAYVLLPLMASCVGFLVRPVARLLSRVESALVARIPSSLERKALVFAVVFPLLSLSFIGSAAYYPFQTIALTLAIVALCAVKQMVEEALPVKRGTTSNINREDADEKGNRGGLL